jgi:hypothetical protein
LGYGPPDVAALSDALARSRQEEDSFLAGWDPSRSPRAAWGMIVLFALFFIGRAAPLLNPSIVASRTDYILMLLYAGVVIGQVRILRSLHTPPAARTSLTGRFWRSRWLRWYWKRTVGDESLAAPTLSHRPTELRLGHSVDELVAVLPLETKRELKGLLPLVRRLEPKTQRIRAWIAELDRLLAEVGRGQADPGFEDKRRAAIEVISRERAIAVARLEEVVATLETIRLNLLRLRAGTGTLHGITANLAVAEEFARHTDRLLAGRAEVERLLSEGRRGVGGAALGP